MTEALTRNETMQECEGCTKFRPCMLFVLQDGNAEFVCRECRSGEDAMTDIIKLPEKASDLIELALRDLRKVEQEGDKYVVDMGGWHEPKLEHRCSVCWAGAVMAGTLGANPAEYVMPSDYGEWNRSRLHALDCFRKGDAVGALRYLGVNNPAGYFGQEPSAYSSADPEPFHATMARTAEWLRAVGQ